MSIYGHSYGGDTAAAAVADANFRVDALVTVDPVSRFGVGSWFGASYSSVGLNTMSWINYSSTGLSFSLPNIIAGIGGAWNASVQMYNTVFQNIGTDHATIMCVASPSTCFPAGK